jgi:hypothetical protein
MSINSKWIIKCRGKSLFSLFHIKYTTKSCQYLHSSSLFEFHASKVSGLVFVCLGVSSMPSQDSEWSCMFGNIIYVLYLYVWEYHLCLVSVCLGISFMSCNCMFGSIIYVLYLYVWSIIYASFYDLFCWLLWLFWRCGIIFITFIIIIVNISPISRTCDGGHCTMMDTITQWT